MASARSLPPPAPARRADAALLAEVVACLGDSLALPPAVVAALDAGTPLFGNLPELDSMAVASVLTALEDRFGILIDDEDVTAGLFETVGTLAAFVSRRLAANRSQAPGRLS